MKINRKKVRGEFFAQAGHKFYILESESDFADANESGFRIRPIAELPEAYAQAGGLRFIHPWSLPENRDYAPQGINAKFKE